MLAVSLRHVLVGEVLVDCLQEEVGNEPCGLVGWVLDVLLVGWVLILGVNLGSCLAWSPLLGLDQVVVEDLIRVDVDEAGITLICHSTTVVGTGDQELDGLPRDGGFPVVGLDRLRILETAHVVGESFGAHQPIRVVEGVSVVPAEGLELLALEE